MGGSGFWEDIRGCEVSFVANFGPHVHARCCVCNYFVQLFEVG
jgi:hypothetical protein